MLKCRLCSVLIDQATADRAAVIVGAGHETMCEACAENLLPEQPPAWQRELIAAAAEAVEVFGEDELERHAAELRPERKAGD